MNKATEYMKDPELTEANTMYSELLLEIYFKTSERNTDLKAWMSMWKRRLRELQDTMVRLFEDQCESGMFKTKSYILDHLGYDWDKFRGVQVLEPAVLNALTHFPNQHTAEILLKEPLQCDRLKKKGRYEAITDQMLVKAKRLQTLEESGCRLQRNGLQINLENQLRRNVSGSSWDDLLKLRE